ncbi:MAG: hypothetical protein AB1752_11030 [Candidatus Zixiibacteriota bacterium]
MLKEGLDVFIPMVDDDAIDTAIRRPDGSFVTVQIKARSNSVKFGDGALFAAIPHELRDNYWFIFYSERLDLMWIMSSSEFVQFSVQNKTGKNAGLRSIWFNGRRRDPESGKSTEYCKKQFERFIARDFSRLLK